MDPSPAPDRSRGFRVLACLIVIPVIFAACTGAVSPTPAESPTSTPVQTRCPVTPMGLTTLTSNRLTAVHLEPSGETAQVVFELGDPATEGQSTPTVSMTVATPPFTQDGSGLPIQVTGERVVQVRFDGMWLYGSDGTPTLQGDRRIDDGGTVRTVVNAGEFEGVSTWLIGFDGPSCARAVTAADGRSLTLEFSPPGG
jgi:hypothetical protein